MIAHKIHQWLASLVINERSSSKLALSFCIGVYIAFSPFVGLHTVMTIIAAWALGLNFAVTFATSACIHNPWTAIPIYGADYVFGEWLLQTLCGLDTLAMNPPWMSFVNESLRAYIGFPQMAFWSFMVGGNLLGIFFSLSLYPLMKRIFIKLVGRVHGVAGAQG